MEDRGSPVNVLDEGRTYAALLALIAWLGLGAGAVPFAAAATFYVDRTDDSAAATACDDENEAATT
jgi:hypothetical protein